MQKTPDLYDNRNREKKNIDANHEKKIVKVGEIRMYKVGVNIGGEISKDGVFMRPCIILKTHVGKDLITIVPLTTKYHELHHYQYLYFDDFTKYGLHQESRILLNQSKTISMKRLVRLCNNINDIPKIPIEVIKKISDKIKKFMFL